MLIEDILIAKVNWKRKTSFHAPNTAISLNKTNLIEMTT